MTAKTFIEFDIPVGRIWSLLSGVVLAGAALKLDASAIALVSVLMENNATAWPLALIGAEIIGACACAIFSFRNFRDAFAPPPQGEEKP